MLPFGTGVLTNSPFHRMHRSPHFFRRARLSSKASGVPPESPNMSEMPSRLILSLFILQTQKASETTERPSMTLGAVSCPFSPSAALPRRRLPVLHGDVHRRPGRLQMAAPVSRESVRRAARGGASLCAECTEVAAWLLGCVAAGSFGISWEQ